MFGLQMKPLSFMNVYFKSGGGGSAGGGGQSGKLDWPTYLKTVHNDWLDATDTDTIEKSVTEVMDSALGASPWSGEVGYDPATQITDAWAAVCAYNTAVDALDNSSDWTSAIGNVRTEIDDNLIEPDFVSNALVQHASDMGLMLADIETAVDAVLDDTTIEADVDAFSQNLDDQVDNNILTKFRAGMRDINAVQSSSFVLGEAIILGMKGRDVAKHESGLRLAFSGQRNEMISKAVTDVINAGKLSLTHRMSRNEIIVNSADQVVKSLLAQVEFEKAVAHLSVEAKRIHIVAKKEELAETWSAAENDANWDLEVFQHGANVLAAIGGGTASPGTAQKQPSTIQSALGGAMSGAAMGATVGGPWGAVVGGAIGLGASLM